MRSEKKPVPKRTRFLSLKIPDRNQPEFYDEMVKLFLVVEFTIFVITLISHL